MIKLKKETLENYENIIQIHKLKHLAIIMDGNRRWAKSKGFKSFKGHQIGSENVQKISKYCIEEKIPYLTLYAFSNENWKRSKIEVNFLMDLFEKYIDKKLPELIGNGIQIKFIGRTKDLHQSLIKKINIAENLTKDNHNLYLNIALNYGGREEIIDTINKIYSKLKLKDQTDLKINHQMFSENLYMKKIPDPDLIIRTGGEQRISNFLLWQSAYSEFITSEKPWPDFCREDLKASISEYHKRNRKFGGN